ncbi:hypothetical protein QAD02_023920 [Eretmocerus hayati]|uniref:Uncharacterized protein n=1 Tax=Eretmocerus hayati TaxID=131215 RepID=A0ACC2Q236_9HYME|nr:hypothetical protein QAD02_023920 [Eretmocerus hayati]
MLKSGADPNAKDSSGKTCLHHLVLRNLMDEELIDLLILSGASPDITDNDGNTPLLLAASLQEIETTLLESRNRELMKKLILAGANIDKTDSKGQTSLHCAAYLRKREAVRLLLSEGALPNISDELGNTPLICALTDNYPYSWKIGWLFYQKY